jgi:hypothetical protein
MLARSVQNNDLHLARLSVDIAMLDHHGAWRRRPAGHEAHRPPDVRLAIRRGLVHGFHIVDWKELLRLIDLVNPPTTRPRSRL